MDTNFPGGKLLTSKHSEIRPDRGGCKGSKGVLLRFRDGEIKGLDFTS